MRRLLLTLQSHRLTPIRPSPPSLCRSRTLLHFIAREVARQLPTGASLAADLPSAGAAARLDRAAVAEELRELAAEARCGAGR